MRSELFVKTDCDLNVGYFRPIQIMHYIMTFSGDMNNLWLNE